MTQSNAISHAKPKRRFGCFAQACIAFLCLIALVAVAVFAWNLVATKRLNAALAKLSAAGHPASEAELMETYTFGDGPNPGPLWLEAGKLLTGKSGPEIAKLPFVGSEAEAPAMPGEPWDQLEPSKAYLAKHADGIALVEEAASMKGAARYKSKFIPNSQEGFSQATIPYQDSHRHIVRVMSMKAYVHAHDGDLDAVADAIVTGIRVGQSLSDEPVLLGQQFSSACVNNALSLVNELISLDFSDAQLARIQQTLRELNPQKSLLRGLEGETLLVVANLSNPLVIGPIPRYEDAAFYVEQVLPALGAAKNGDWKAIHKAEKDIKSQAIAAGGPNGARYAMSHLSLTSTASYLQSKSYMASNISVHDALLAARRFQLANDKLPESLDELVPDYLTEVPVDPWSPEGKPLLFKKSKTGIKIYSRSFNQVDDQGNKEVEQGTPLDVVVELESSSRP